MESKLDSNPWLTILTKPKKTIRSIVDFNPNYRLLLLSMIYGFSAILGIAQNMKIGGRLDLITIIISAFILAPIWGYLAFSISSWFVFFTGKWIGGKGKYKEVRSAMAWSNVPTIASGFFWIILILFFGSSLFGDVNDKQFLTSAQVFGVLSIMFIQLVASIWSLVIYINSLAEVQSFSILRSIFNILLSILLVLAIILVIAFISRWTCSPFFDCPKLVMAF